MNKLQYSSLNQLWIPSVLASAGAIVCMYLLPSLAVGTPLKFELGSLRPVDVFVSFGLVGVGTLIGLVGIVRSSRRLPAIMATIVGLVMVVAVTFPFLVGGD
jgi:hypothetical protein